MGDANSWPTEILIRMEFTDSANRTFLPEGVRPKLIWPRDGFFTEGIDFQYRGKYPANRFFPKNLTHII